MEWEEKRAQRGKEHFSIWSSIYIIITLVGNSLLPMPRIFQWASLWYTDWKIQKLGHRKIMEKSKDARDTHTETDMFSYLDALGGPCCQPPFYWPHELHFPVTLDQAPSLWKLHKGQMLHSWSERSFTKLTAVIASLMVEELGMPTNALFFQPGEWALSVSHFVPKYSYSITLYYNY